MLLSSVLVTADLPSTESLLTVTVGTSDTTRPTALPYLHHHNSSENSGSESAVITITVTTAPSMTATNIVQPLPTSLESDLLSITAITDVLRTSIFATVAGGKHPPRPTRAGTDSKRDFTGPYVISCGGNADNSLQQYCTSAKVGMQCTVNSAKSYTHYDSACDICTCEPLIHPKAGVPVFGEEPTGPEPTARAVQERAAEPQRAAQVDMSALPFVQRSGAKSSKAFSLPLGLATLLLMLCAIMQTNANPLASTLRSIPASWTESSSLPSPVPSQSKYFTSQAS